jgi:5-methylcytosine-specific restriction endonuclease McrA
VIIGCLALNASFEPLTMVPMRRALRLVLDGKAEIIEADPDRLVRSARLTLPRPAVIRLVKFIHVPRRFRRQVTNTFLFARDRYRCQYCGRTLMDLRPRESLTRDHLVPLSRGGTNDWTNVVTACSQCNTRKGNRMAEEIGMHPLVPPVEPHFVHLSWAVRRLTPAQSNVHQDVLRCRHAPPGGDAGAPPAPRPRRVRRTRRRVARRAAGQGRKISVRAR